MNSSSLECESSSGVLYATIDLVAGGIQENHNGRGEFRDRVRMNSWRCRRLTVDHGGVPVPLGVVEGENVARENWALAA